jgi:hypothetical protein
MSMSGVKLRNAFRVVYISVIIVGIVLISFVPRPSIRDHRDVIYVGFGLIALGFLLGLLQRQITVAIFRFRGMSRQEADSAFNKQGAEDWPDDGRYKNFMRGKPKAGEAGAHKPNGKQGE